MKRIGSASSAAAILSGSCALLLTTLLTCSPVYVGGGSDTEVSGRIVSPTGTGLSGAFVTLVRTDYDPVFGGRVPPGNVDTTDSIGSYRFSGVSSGSYDLLAVDPVSGGRLLSGALAVDPPVRTLVLNDDSLKKSVHLIVNLPDTLVALSGWIVAAGTTVYVKKIAGDTSVTIDSMPQGTVPAIRFETAVAHPGSVLFANVIIGPSDTTVLNPYRGWTHSAKVRINTSVSGVPVPTVVTDFCCAVRLTASTFPFSQAKPGGADIRFTKANGLPIPFEIATWDSASALAVVWIGLDTIYPNSADQFVRMFWGNPVAASASNPNATFDTARGYTGVWHLEEERAGTGTPGLYKDATPNAANGTDSVSSSDTSGVVGNGCGFAAGDKIPVSGPVADLGASAFTACVWVNFAFSGGVVFSKTKSGLIADTGDKELWFGDSAAAGGPGLRPSFTGVGQGTITAQRDMGVNQWHCYALRRQPDGSLNFYIDGGLCAFTGVYTPQSADDPSAHFIIGSDGTHFLAGSIDELHVSKIARSDDWIMLSFENQRQNQHVVTIEIEK